MKKHLITITTTLSAILIVSTATYAIGTLTPTGTAGDNTQYSLNDIYSKLVDFTDTPSATSSPFTIPGSVSASFHTLSEIYGLLEAEEDLVPENIKDGTTIFGVEGTLSASAPTLEWSTDQGIMNWTTAVSTCAGTVDGSAGWRLPTVSELMAGISDDWIVEDDNEGDHFAFDTVYWSGTQYSESYAWYISFGGAVSSDIGNKDSGQHFVNCVR